MAIDREKVLHSLESLGEPEVRVRVAQGVYGAKLPLVLEWLRQKDEAKNDQRVSQEHRLAQEANDIAKAALGEAKVSNKWAVWALCISLLALLLSVLGYAT